ncbi:hypothetical protein [Frigoriflavimonas asaccharolytica]|uniref:Uncharacterized protein n=1 Tax=Frigoriflavimonas asaccharolytica TaxID=2735899 RepID=A0A8J8KA85_9FLAO|nr:hypothetical protein [Frigoriflavimonas asaccharolytica]NRS93902.1 hypothetical protein [Frigoriflavimonas asaccharolytica]
MKHIDAVLKIDTEDLDEFHTKYYIQEYGEEYMKERIKNKFWFAYPALLRITFELEFGQKYIDFSANRDKI